MRLTHYSRLKNSSGTTQGSMNSSNSSNGSRRRAAGTHQEFYKFILRRKTVLSDSGGKAPVVSFIFEPKITHMFAQLIQYDSVLMNSRMAYNLHKFDILIHVIDDVRREMLCLEGSPAPVPLSLGNYHKFRVVNAGSVIQRSYTPVAQHRLKSGQLGYEYYI
eukprot:4420-Heterococcus_DN1.PRE.6